MPTILLFTIGLFVTLINLASAIPTISAVGAKFFTSDGNQFFIKGVAYQLTSKDPLIDTNQCQLDASLMKTLGANAIRVYHVDPSQDHQGCMSAFADAGVYLFVDLDDFPTQIVGSAPTWNQSQATAFEKVLDEFQKYDNTAGVLVGNEVITTTNVSYAAPYVLAAARDIKAYRNSKKYRNIPVGYSAADIASLRPMLQDYLACHTNASERVDFFSLNAYEWCGASSYTQSGYDQLQANAKGYPVPIFFSETGCNTNPPRDFADQAAIFGPQMSDTWSGAIIYEWIEETNNYGLVNYGPPNNAADGTNTNVQDGFTRSGTPTPIQPDFSNLQAQWKTLSPSSVALSAYSATAASLTPAPCPSSTAGGWIVNPSAPLPTVGQAFNEASITGSVAPSSTAAGSSAAGSSGSGASASASASAKKGAAKKAMQIPLTGEGSVMGMIAALLAVGAGFLWLL